MISRYDFIRPKIYPIFIVAIACMVGIWLQSRAFALQATCGIGCACIIIGILYGLYAQNRMIVITIIVSTIAFAAGAFRYQALLDKQKSFINLTDSKTYTIKGTVIDYRRTGKPRPSHRMIMHISHIENATGKILVDAPVLIYSQRLEHISIADTIMIHDVHFKHKYAPEFSYYLLKEGTLASIFLQNQELRKICRPRTSLARWLFYFRKDLVQRCRLKMNPTAYLYFASIFLGDPETKKLIDPIKQQLQCWGLVHYLARAGLHVVIFIALWQFMLRLLPLSFCIKELILILLCFLYALLSWPSIPFQRAFLSFIITRSCTLMRLRVYYIPVLMIIMIITLLGNPIYLFSLDFQLSFGVTFALAWFNEIQARYYS